MKVDKKEVKELIIRFATTKTKDLKEYLKEGEYRGQPEAYTLAA